MRCEKTFNLRFVFVPEHRAGCIKQASVFREAGPQRIEKARLLPCEIADVCLTAQPFDVGMSPHDARCRAGHIGEDQVERAAVPPRRRPCGVAFAHVDGRVTVRQPRQILPHSREAAGIGVERDDLDIGEFGEMRRLAARCGAGVEHAHAFFGPKERTRELGACVLHGECAFRKARQLGDRARRRNDDARGADRRCRDAGIPDYNRHHIGHGIGLEMYDIPTLSPGDATPIEEGMVFEVETPYYELGYGGLQPEDTVLVTAQGGQFLNGISRQLELWK